MSKFRGHYCHFKEMEQCACDSDDMGGTIEWLECSVCGHTKDTDEVGVAWRKHNKAIKLAESQKALTEAAIEAAIQYTYNSHPPTIPEDRQRFNTMYYALAKLEREG